MTQERNITRIDAFTYREILSRDPIILIPVGSIEQHGPHMPLGVDTLLSTMMAELTAESIGAYVGPTVSTGYKSQQRSGGGNHIIGSFGFDAQTVIGVCRTLVREFCRHGARRIVFINGHYENYQFIYEGVDLALRDLEGQEAPARVMMVSYWDFVTDEVIAELYPDGFPGWDVEHGGVMETSLMLTHFPDLVHMDRVMDLPAAQLPAYDLLPVDASLTPESGCLSSALASSEAKGRILTDSVVEEMGRAILERLS
ncbi:creatininase [Actinomyces bowdenii]|uniref:Creatininase n=1 Tax=Actinomyces bowdenii TaxID=131109 RepID=A0A853EIY4_9ACTO|nr:creatininase [Actinomyces bowdenii]MBF0696552.1 creatininase [Actinomyces bowdenii]MDO5063589.1 creatininase [Actinomyces bowdenii]NYS68725.1 creatininase [Actinomyces bowdenii]